MFYIAYAKKRATDYSDEKSVTISRKGKYTRLLYKSYKTFQDILLFRIY